MSQTSTSPSYSLSSDEINRVLSAAIINEKFRNLLLTDAERALTTGCNGEIFRLGLEEKKLILSIKAKSLTDFADQLAKRRYHYQPGSLCVSKQAGQARSNENPPISS
jgi:hypothetical protein